MRLIIKHKPSQPQGIKYALYNIWQFLMWDGPDLGFRWKHCQCEDCVKIRAELDSSGAPFKRWLGERHVHIYIDGTEVEYSSICDSFRAGLNAEFYNTRPPHLVRESGRTTTNNRISFISSLEGLETIQNECVSNDIPTIIIDSKMLLPRSLYTHHEIRFLEYLVRLSNNKQNIALPLITYKHTYENHPDLQIRETHGNTCLFKPSSKAGYSFRGQKIKNPQICTDQFYDLCGCGQYHENENARFIPTEDERFRVDGNLLHKLISCSANMPYINPSPYIHGWGAYWPAVFNNNDAAESLKFRNFEFAIHRFEEV